jgi:hypothetical protein
MSGKKIGLAMLFALTSFSLFAGPFGLEMGMSLQELKAKTGKEPEPVQDDLYKVDPVNKNNMFEAYIVRVHPKYGVYLIRGIGKNIETSGYGTEVKSAFNTLVAGVEKTYSKYKKTDFLRSKSIWNESRDWMMGMVKKERFLFAEWSAESGATLPADIKNIFVAANALSNSKGYVVIEYYSPNDDKVTEEKTAQQDSVF